jgi:hypothetical protein
MQKQHLDSFSTLQKLLDVKELTTYEKLLCVVLTVSANGKNECEPTVNTLAQLCSCSHRQIRRALKLLEAKGYVARTAQFIEADNNTQAANKYILQFVG